MALWTRQVLEETRRENWADVFRFASVEFGSLYDLTLFEKPLWYRLDSPTPVRIIDSIVRWEKEATRNKSTLFDALRLGLSPPGLILIRHDIFVVIPQLFRNLYFGLSALMRNAGGLS